MNIGEFLILAVIMVLILVVLPGFFARKSGKSLTEIILGRRVNGTIFGRKEAKDGSQESKKKQTNSSKNNLLEMISTLISYARRNHFYFLVPGTIIFEGQTASLAAILITRSMVIGVNCFGYGGTVTAGKNEADWEQILNEETRSIPSPVKKNREQKRILSGALAKLGYPDVPVEILGVFTAKDVQLKQTTGTGCYHKNGLMEYLRADRMIKDLGVNAEEIGKALETVRAIK